ncbi:winged helix-turn-helix domain-containing protein [Edaphovirga cremea]|uniref:winged helix-turn-helix domain-containing protein n=1 Tax=Edaphovirga cremea TaxID=2267246 RepID=UPI000DF006B1|nr:winged helix-turn-helix domain-containing protein [Edaphovirga cremea]
MIKGFLINNAVYFVPEKNLLIAKNDPSLTVLLNAPVSRCLLLLIEKQHDIISQKVFLHEVWESNGSSVSANSLYQSISLLRKAFKSVGLHDVIITTVPRKGLTLHESIQISVVGGNEAEGYEVDDSMTEGLEAGSPVMDDSLANGARVDNLGEESHELSPETLSPAVNNSVIPAKNSKHPLLRWEVLGIIGVLIVIIISCFIWINKTMDSDKNSFQGYSASIRKDNCEFFFKPSTNALTEYTRFIESHEFTCKGNRKIFLTINFNKEGAAVVQCDPAAESFQPELCETPYYVGNSKVK